MIESQVGEHIDRNLEISASASRSKVAVNFSERDARVKIDAVLFQLRLLENEFAHELAEQLSHRVHALLPCGHVIESMTHGEEDRLDTTSARRVIQFCVTARDVADAHESDRGLHGLQCFLEAVKTAHSAEGELLFPGEKVLVRQCLKEIHCISVVCVVIHFVGYFC